MPLLEAVAVIRAKDETGAVFAAIEKKIAELSKQVAAVNGAVGAVGKSTKEVAAVNREIGAAVAATSSMADHMERVSGHVSRVSKEVSGWRKSLSEASAAVAPTLGLGAAFLGYEGVKHVVDVNFNRQHERVRMLNSGMSGPEIADAELAAAQLSAKYAAVDQTAIMHMLRNTRSIVGSYAQAKDIVDPLLALRVVATGAHPGAEMQEDFDKLVKGLEIKGVTQDPAKFRAYIDAMGKAVNAFGDTLRPTDFYEMFKYGRQATQNLSLEYMAGVGPKLAQELGGASAGQAQSAFFNAIVGGHMTKTALKRLEDFGLVDTSKVVSPKGGGLANAAGAIKGSALAAMNPYEWVNQILLPAMAKKGVIDPEKIQEVIGSMFSKSTAAQLVSILATQQDIIDKDIRVVRGTASTAEAAQNFLTQDPIIAAKGLANAFDNLAAEFGLGSANMAGAMSSASGAINRFVAGLDAERAREDYFRTHGYPDDTPPYAGHTPDAATDRMEALHKQIEALDPATAPGRFASLQAEADALGKELLDQQFNGPARVAAWRRLDEVRAQLKMLEGGDAARAKAQAELKRLDDADVDMATLYNMKRWSDRDLGYARTAQGNAPGSWRRDKNGGMFVFPADYQHDGGAPYSVPSVPANLWGSVGNPFSDHPYGEPGRDDAIERARSQQRISEVARESVSVDVKGSATLEGRFIVEASSVLLNIVKTAENFTKEIPLVGTSRAGIAPNGQGGIGHR